MAGTGRVTVAHATYLQQHGHSVTVVARLACPPGPYQGVQYVHCDSPAALRAFFRQHPCWDVALVVASPKVLMLTYWLPRLRLRLLSVHIGPMATPEEAVARQRIWRMNAFADAVLCVSNALAALLRSQGVRAEKLHVVHNGVDTRVFYPHPVPRQKRRLVFAGALVPLKGIDTLLQAFGQVKAHFADAELVICGAAELYGRTAYRPDPALLPGDGSVQFRGSLSQAELAREFSQAALAVVPSSARRCFEGFGMVSLEAQACGCPVVVTHNGGLPETVIDGVTGRVCPPDDPEALAKCLCDLLAEPLRLQRMGAAACAHVRQRFTWERTLQPLGDLVARAAGTASLPGYARYVVRWAGLLADRLRYGA